TTGWPGTVATVGKWFGNSKKGLIFGIWNSHTSLGNILASAGVAQTTGWPGTVATVGKWFGNSKKGLIFGIWNSHTSLGNILGTLMAARFVERDWALSFVYPALVMGVVAFMVFLFLAPDPRMVGIVLPERTPVRTVELSMGLVPPPTMSEKRVERVTRNEWASSEKRRVFACDGRLLAPLDSLVRGGRQADIAERPSRQSRKSIDEDEPTPSTVIVGDQAASLRPNRHSANAQPQHDEATEHTALISRPAPAGAVSLSRALRIPGVLEFSFSLFFAKLVSYTFLYWLPLYINTSTHLTPKQSGDLSTVFDVGGIVGAVLAGLIADCCGCPGAVCACFYIVCAPTLLAYQSWGASSYALNVCLLVACGVLVNGPYALITTAVSAELVREGTEKDRGEMRIGQREVREIEGEIESTGRGIENWAGKSLKGRD
ncbi:hypothetical protein MSG28_015057, partial [Choristoneura fumiferana]